MRILSIDAGSYSLKTLELESSFNRFEILDYHESILPTSEDRYLYLNTWLQKSKKPDQMIIALPQKSSTFRNINLPTRDKKAIQSAVQFELEDNLPFPLEEHVSTFSILSQNKQGSQIHVASTLKQHLTQTLSQELSGPFDPDIITTEPWAYRTLFNRILAPDPSSPMICLLQLGHQQSTLYLHHQGTPLLCHTIAWGGMNLTTALCEKYSLSFEQAESFKKDRGLIAHSTDPLTQQDLPHPLGAEPNALSHCFEQECKKLLFEIRYFFWIAQNMTQQKVSLIYLGGGSSLLPGLGEWLQNELNITTQPLHALSMVSKSGIHYSQTTEAQFLLATALSLSSVGSERAQCLNFRKGEWQKESKLEPTLALKKFQTPMIWSSWTIFCIFFSLFFQSQIYRKKIQQTHTGLEKSIREFFGPIPSSALKTYLSSTTTLKESIQKELNKNRHLASLWGPHSNSPLDFLKTLSSSLPKDLKIDLMEVQIGKENVSSTETPLMKSKLTFLLAQEQTAEELYTILNHKILKNFKKTTPEKIVKTHQLKVTFSGELLEKSHEN